MNTKPFEELIDQIRDLNRDRLYLSTKLFAIKRKSNEPSDEVTREINELESKISEIDNKLTPLLSDFYTNSNKYLVEYEGEFTDINGHKYRQIITECLYFKTSVSIDTFKNGLNGILLENAELIDEIFHFLFYNRFTNFTVLNIKSM